MSIPEHVVRGAWGSSAPQFRTARMQSADVASPSSPPLTLVVHLCDRLRAAKVVYCHWKSNDMLHLSASGDNDLDLLVDPGCLDAFLGVLSDCGFKQGRPSRRRRVPGVLHYYGLDVTTGTLVHVDAQAHLVLGDDTTKNVRLPMENSYLASCRSEWLFPVPAPEFELAVLVVRLALKHGTWDAAAFGLAPLRSAEWRELEYLNDRADKDALRRVVEEQLPQIGWSAWSGYFGALMHHAPLRTRLAAGRRVVAGTSELMRRPAVQDTALRCWRRLDWGVRHYVFGQRNTKRLRDGGRVIAVVGGDGAGKSTLVRNLARWLNGPFDTQVVHMGKPPHNVMTLVVKGGILLARRSRVLRNWLPNYPAAAERVTAPSPAWLLWQWATAEDRRRLHRRVRRLAARGYVVVCDRFPVPQVSLMDGSRTGWVPVDQLSPLARRIAAAERRCYASITEPDLLLVLRVDPDTAVARKAGVDPAEFVRPRSEEVFAAPWESTEAVVLDASRSSAEVLAAARVAVWASL